MSGNTIFSGNSRYANDFQQVIERSVAIASLPLKQLTNQRADLNDRSAALNSLESKFSALQSALASLDSAVANNLNSSSVSDTSVLKASVAPEAVPGEYSIEVVSIGARTSTMSTDALPKVADPSAQSISAATDFTLTVDGAPYSIAPVANTLSSLASAINAAAGSKVQATVVNIGSSSAPDYRLSVQTKDLAAIAVQLNDGTEDLMSTLVNGSPATYRINGQPADPISTNSRTVTVAPGVTASLLKEGSAEVIVSHSTSAITGALTSFANAFNSAVDELDKHYGKVNGALTGQSVIYELSQALRKIANYSSGGDGIASLTDLGLTFDKSGKLAVDSNALSNAPDQTVDNLVAFLGSSTDAGFLRSATDVLGNIEDSTDGLLPSSIRLLQQQIAGQDKTIADNQYSVDQLRETLSTQMAAADSLIASLEQQATYFTNLFESMRQNASNK